MESHGYRLTCLRASALPSAPHSLRSARARGSEVPMDQGGGVHVSRGDQWFARGLNIIQWTPEVCHTAAGRMLQGFESWLTSFGAPVALGARIEHVRALQRAQL